MIYQKQLHDPTLSAVELIAWQHHSVATRAESVTRVESLLALIAHDKGPRAKYTRREYKAELARLHERTSVEVPLEEARKVARAACVSALEAFTETKSA